MTRAQEVASTIDRMMATAANNSPALAGHSRATRLCPFGLLMVGKIDNTAENTLSPAACCSFGSCSSILLGEDPAIA